jgi:RND family efflux transporter MFP subunit
MCSSSSSSLHCVSVAVLVVVALAGAACGGSGPSAPAAAAGRAGEPRDVDVTPVVEDRLQRLVTVTGTLAAEDQVSLGFKVPGRLEMLPVDLGSQVQEGQVLARLLPVDYELRVRQAESALQQARARLGLAPDESVDDVDPQATAIVRQAKAVLDDAKLTYDRIATFVDRGISAKSELDAAAAALTVADSRHQDALEEVRNRQAILAQRRSELELARQDLVDTRILAPFAGMIRERSASLGQFVASGTPVVTLVRMHPLRLQADVPEREALAVRIGQEVRVRLEGDERVYAGRVARVSPVIDEATRSLRVEAEVANQAALIRPGSFATADIVVASDAAAVLVPSSAIVTFAGVEKVMTVEDGTIVEKRVSLGRRDNGRVEVLSGVATGAVVVTEPGNLVDGERVRIR